MAAATNATAKVPLVILDVGRADDRMLVRGPNRNWQLLSGEMKSEEKPTECACRAFRQLTGIVVLPEVFRTAKSKLEDGRPVYTVRAELDWGTFHAMVNSNNRDFRFFHKDEAWRRLSEPQRDALR